MTTNGGAVCSDAEFLQSAMEENPVYQMGYQAGIAKGRELGLELGAEICDDLHYTWRFGDGDDSVSGPKECASAIRERSRDQ